MDAREAGLGYVVPMPRFFSCHIGDIVYIDEDGVVRTTGSVFEDGYFKELLEGSQTPEDRTNSVQEYPSRTYAFATGCVQVKALTDEECAGYIIHD